VDDSVLRERLVAGDDSALVEVFDQLGSFVFGLARRLTGSASIAEDVGQEVFSELWRRPERFDPDRGSLRAYLGVMTHRRSVDAVRRTERSRARDEKAALLAPASAAHQDIGDAAALAQSVEAALAGLPDDQRRAVELAFWQGMTHHEIARALGVAEGTVKSRLRLAQAKLRRSLSGLAVVSA
jgi:RNA polymerase sigma-70 factor (ECF subfamily)